MSEVPHPGAGGVTDARRAEVVKMLLSAGALPSEVEHYAPYTLDPLVIQSPGSRVQGSGCRVQGSGLETRVQGSVFGGQSLPPEGERGGETCGGQRWSRCRRAPHRGPHIYTLHRTPRIDTLHPTLHTLHCTALE